MSVTKIERTAVMWAALQKAAGKELRRESLEDGALYAVNLLVTGRVAGGKVDMPISGSVQVGMPRQQASTEAVPVDQVLAIVLERLPEGPREKLLRELPERFAENGSLPEAAADVLEAAKLLLERLRNKVTKEVRGNVICNYRLAAPDGH